MRPGRSPPFIARRTLTDLFSSRKSERQCSDVSKARPCRCCASEPWGHGATQVFSSLRCRCCHLPQSSRLRRKKHYKKRQSSPECERQACRCLATAIHTKLPRELRDVVYKHAIEEPKLFYVHELPQDKIADVESVRRIYSQSYVGLEVAREAAEYYYSREHIIANFQNLRETLTRDVFHLGVKPYMHIQTLHVRIRIDEISGSLVRRGGTDKNGRLKESQSVKEAVVQEKINLNNLYQKLEAGFSLFKGTREPSFLKLVVNLKMDKYPPCWDRVYQRDITVMRDHERRFMNALETIRKPVYDMIHTGCTVEVKFAPEYYNGQERDDGRCDDDSESETFHYRARESDKGSEKSDEDCHCNDDPDDGLAVLNLTPSLFHLTKEEREKVRSSPTATPSTPTNKPPPPPGKSYTQLPPRPLQP